MPDKKVRFRETLRDTSAQWCERNKIPAGYAVTALRQTGRQVRSDVSIYRQVLPQKAADHVTLKTALDELQECFITELKKRGWSLRLRRANRSILDGRYLMSSIRLMEPSSFDEFRQFEQEDQILDAQRYFSGIGPSIECSIGIEETYIIRGALRELAEEYGFGAVKKAAESENII